jgi:DNA-binding MarR family transcriptional regulator
MARARWLDHDEQESWRAFLDANRLLMAALDRQLQRDAELSLADYDLLVRLSEAPERRLRMSELAEATLFSRSRLSHAVSRLESAGWVVRTACPEDKRGLFAELTQAGMDKLTAAAPGHVAAVREHLVDVLSPAQLRQLGEISTAVRAQLNGH